MMIEGWQRLPRTLRVALMMSIAMGMVRLAIAELEVTSPTANIAFRALYEAVFFGTLVGAFRCLPRLPAAGIGLRLAIAGLLGLLVIQLAFTGLFEYSASSDSYDNVEHIVRILGYLSLAVAIVGVIGWAIAARSVAIGVVLVVATVGVYESSYIILHLTDDMSPRRLELASGLFALVEHALVAVAAAQMAGRAPAAAVPRSGGLGDFAAAMWLAVAAVGVVMFAAIALDHHERAADVFIIIAMTTGLIGAARLGLGGAALDDEPGATGWLAAGAALLGLGCAGVTFSELPSMLELVVRTSHYRGPDDGRSIVAILVAGAVAMVLALAAAAGLARRLGAAPVAGRLTAVLIAAAVLVVYAFVQIWISIGDNAWMVKAGLAGLAGVGAVAAAAVVFTHAANQLGVPQLPTATLRS
jgi:hypothetical protein